MSAIEQAIIRRLEQENQDLRWQLIQQDPDRAFCEEHMRQARKDDLIKKLRGENK